MKLLVLLGFIHHVLPECPCAASEFKLDGEYLLGGLFRIHDANASIVQNRPVVLECTQQDFSLSDYRMFQVMRFAVQEINNSTLILPNVSLGYDIFDYCSDVLNFPAILDLISRNGYRDVQDSARVYPSKVVGVIGPFGSAQTLNVAPLFMINFIPMVNYVSTSSALSDKVKYPSFFRTVASNKHTIQVIIAILKHFSWRWVAFLSSSDTYSKEGFEIFKRQIHDTDICLAYEGNLGRSRHDIIFKNIDKLKINVIIVLTLKKNAEAIVRSAIRYNMRNKVWIAGDTWSLDKRLIKLNGIQSIGTILGVSERSFATLPGFNDFVHSSREQRQCTACRSKSLGQTSCCQACEACNSVSAQEIIDESPSYNVAIYSAVYAVAHALHNVLQCSSGGCQHNITVHPSMVLKKLKESNFTLLNSSINFNAHGDPSSVSYSIVYWRRGSKDPVTVGSYETNPVVRLAVNKTEIHWHTNGTVPVRSVCSWPCKKGYMQNQDGDHKCCFTCEICPPDTYVNSAVKPYKCKKCKKTEWSDPGSTTCLERTVEYTLFTDPAVISITILNSFMLALLLAVTVLFAYHYNTPVVKSAGGPMCLVILGSLGVSGTGVFFYVGKPTEISCIVGKILYIVPYNFCLACFAVRSFQIVGIFKMAAKFPKIYKLWVKHKGQWLVVAVVFVIETALVTAWLATDTPKPYNDTTSFKDQIITKCSTGNPGLMYTIISSTGILCGLCFTFSYMAKDLPKNYNEAKAITFCLLQNIIAWITLITVNHSYRGKNLQMLNAGLALCTVHCFLLWYFLPKCYIIIWQPQKNTQQHFQGLIQSYTQTLSK